MNAAFMRRLWNIAWSSQCNQQPATSNQYSTTRALAGVFFFAVALSVVLQVGCSDTFSSRVNAAGSTAESADPSRPAPISLTDWRAKDPDAFKTPEQPLVIDAGIVFAGQPTYLCYPIEKFGITNADDIIDITTSCECVTMEKVKYEHADGTVKDAIKISVFFPKTGKLSILSVAIAVSLSGEQLIDFRLGFSQSIEFQ